MPFEQGALHFHFALGPTNNVVGPGMGFRYDHLLEDSAAPTVFGALGVLG